MDQILNVIPVSLLNLLRAAWHDFHPEEINRTYSQPTKNENCCCNASKAGLATDIILLDFLDNIIFLAT